MASKIKNSNRPVLFLVGPTATGKSEIAIHLAKKLCGEIISADSMQIYRGMNIGTATPTAQERKRVRYHLIDIIPPTEEFSFFKYRALALKAIEAISQKGLLPIVVGGTGLYIRSLIEGIEALPGKLPALRAELEMQATQKGTEFLYGKLQKVAPQRARELEPNDQKRIIRALEIQTQNGKYKKSKSKSLTKLGYQPLIFGLNRERQFLYEAINARVDKMFRRGLVREVRSLKKKALSLSAAQAVGYKELFAYFEGQCTLQEAKDKIKQGSRRLAKRQMTWFKKEPGLVWFSLDPYRSSQKAAEALRLEIEFGLGGQGVKTARK